MLQPHSLAACRAASSQGTHDVQDCCYHPTEPVVAVGIITGRLQTWSCSAETPSKRICLQAHSESCRAVHFMPQGDNRCLQMVITASTALQLQSEEPAAAACSALGCSRALNHRDAGTPLLSFSTDRYVTAVTEPPPVLLPFLHYLCHRQAACAHAQRVESCKQGRSIS